MKTFVIPAATCLLLTSIAPIALAAPSTRVDVKPSAVFIYATNAEERSYNCSISFVWSHDDFGTRKSQSSNATAVVNPKVQNALIFQLSGSYVQLRIESGPNIQCT